MISLLAAFACVATFTSPPEYRDGAYRATFEVNCSKAPTLTESIKVIDNTGQIRHASFKVIHVEAGIKVISEVVIDRPWIAPVPIFMEVAKTKHRDNVLEEVNKILGS